MNQERGKELFELSIVVATRNRSVSLSRTLESIDQQVSPRLWECIIVDNGSTDNTQEVARRFSHSAKCHFRLIREAKPGLANAHNAGVLASRSPIVAFTDDDCYLMEGYVDHLLNFFEESHRLGFVGGRILLYDPTDLRMTISESTERVEIAPGSFIQAGVIQGANFAVRREALVQVKGFDPFFGPGALFNAEDIDAVARISNAGWAGAYDPRPTVWHHHGRKTREEARVLHESYARGRGAYYLKSILRRGSRYSYARGWFPMFRHQKLSRTWRELKGAASYAVHAILDRGRRFVPFESNPPQRTNCGDN